MKANELRPGNYLLIDNVPQQVLAIIPNENSVEFIDGEYFKILFKHHKYNTSFETYSDDNVEPIPPTEVILLRLGFEKTSCDEMTIVIKNEVFYYKLFKGYIEWNGNKILKKYIHEIQNLIYELTGEELTIKTDKK